MSNSEIEEFIKKSKLQLHGDKLRLNSFKKLKENNLNDNELLQPLSVKHDSSLKENQSDTKFVNKDTKSSDLNIFQAYDVLVEKINNVKQESTNIANSTKCPSNYCQMDQQLWVTDQFYSHFPSFQNRKKELELSRNQEYNIFLNQLELKSLQKKGKENFRSRENQARKHLESISGNGEFPTYKQEPETIEIVDDKTLAEMRKQKKLQYQQELVQQIEEKKKEMEKIRAKEKEEEELLTRRLQQQLETMKLEEELRQEKARIEEAKIKHEQYQIYRLNMLSNIQNNSKHHNNNTYINQRQSQSENGKDKLMKIVESPPNEKIYKYFSNSARGLGKSKSVSLNDSTDDDISIISPLTHQSHNEYCKRCLASISSTAICNYCELKRNSLPLNENVCLKCNKMLRSLKEKQNGLCEQCKLTKIKCGFCQKHIDICPKCNAVFCLRCHNRQDDSPIAEVESGINISPVSDSKKIGIYRPFTIVNYSTDDSDDNDEAQLSNVRSKNEKSFSTNFKKNSLFNPKNVIEEPKLSLKIRNGEIFVDDLDEKMAKYARNYGELFKDKRKSMDLLTMPLMPAKKVTRHTKDDREQMRPNIDSTAIQRLKQKWEIPAVQKNVIQTKSNTRVLTQLGAIRKQLQIEQMQLDSTFKNTNS